MKSTPGFSRWILGGGALLLLGCNHVSLIREYFPNGRLAEEQAFLVFPEDDYRVQHGFHQTWYPNGSRRTLEVFDHGVQQGYSFQWNERDSLVRLEYCAEGICHSRLPAHGVKIASAFP